MPRTILLATSNPHKLEEVRAILEPLEIGVVGLKDVPGGSDIPEPAEDGETFEANARKKAIAYAKATGRLCLADDSGLEVDALGGRPGVHSARYAGSEGERAERDEANNRKLLKELDGVPEEERTARFVCSMCVASPEGKVLATSRGLFEGRIAHEPRGTNGFGYDPLLILEDGRTSAELSTREKNARSHRGEAAKQIAPALVRLMEEGGEGRASVA